MSKIEQDDSQYQRGLIITDDVSPAPILDFKESKEAILRVIKDSYPKFSVGICGDWVIGKTTLMRSISDQLDKDKKDGVVSLVPVWFNAWKYEREEHFTLIPLLKTIERSLPIG